MCLIWLLCVLPPSFLSVFVDLGPRSSLHSLRSICKAIVNNPQLLIIRWQRCAINQQKANEFHQTLCGYESENGVVEMEKTSFLGFFCLSLKGSFCVFTHCAHPYMENIREWMNGHCTDWARRLLSEIKNRQGDQRRQRYSPWNRDRNTMSDFYLDCYTGSVKYFIFNSVI